MKTVIEEDEEDLAPLHRQGDSMGQQDRELTLSSRTLLMIFFGLVLICGLFFGLGYTLGRRSPSETGTVQAADASTTTPQTEPAPSSSQKPSASAQAKPVTSEPVAQDTPAQDSAAPDTSAGSNPETTGNAAASSAAQSQSTPAANTPAGTVKPALPPATTSGVDQAPAPGSVMVQIAAVSNQADADVLLSALRKRGYSVIARHESTDSLLHVQVGPFTTRAEAAAMRQKLLNDGYNAILK
jgi:DedD protein